MGLLLNAFFCRAEEERRADIAERDALAERMKQKDADKTRNIVTKSDKKVSIFVPCTVQPQLSEPLWPPPKISAFG